MTATRPIILIGAGGHCRSLIDVIESVRHYEVGPIVGRPEEVGEERFGYPISHADEDLPRLLGPGTLALVAVGQIESATIRRKLYDQILQGGGEPPVLTSASSLVSDHARLGPGTVAMHHSIVNANATVGRNVILNTRCLIEHDASVGDHCHISTGAIINGAATIGAGTFVGSGAVVCHGITIPPESVVGAGQFVRRGDRFRGRIGAARPDSKADAGSFDRD